MRSEHEIRERLQNVLTEDSTNYSTESKRILHSTAVTLKWVLGHERTTVCTYCKVDTQLEAGEMPGVCGKHVKQFIRDMLDGRR